MLDQTQSASHHVRLLFGDAPRVLSITRRSQSRASGLINNHLLRPQEAPAQDKLQSTFGPICELREQGCMLNIWNKIIKVNKKFIS